MQFENLNVWQDARHLVAQIYATGNSSPLAENFGLRDQIRRSAVSVMTNIAEGFERTTIKEKRYFYSIARGSCGETRSLLYVVLDAQYISHGTFQDLVSQTIQIGKQLTALIASIQRRT